MKPEYICKVCDTKWHNRESFLSDVDITLLGYQVNFFELEAGFFLFNHSCGETLAIKVENFTDLYDGEIFENPKTDSDECPKYCLYQENLDRCPVECECAFVREIIQIIKKYPKKQN